MPAMRTCKVAKGSASIISSKISHKVKFFSLRFNLILSIFILLLPEGRAVETYQLLFLLAICFFCYLSNNFHFRIL